ncbi:Uu.00g111230.m01.CDS01 [Anthostomella pinea]|uniref:Uu.00g111230.m01.CDS01 n=1 Tax=Anthostomella pinea TaxID=933095 RepID=A0AAI8VG10_9PEZI|nr:Uu.00g111230.m01.CDS01 [Anthostomella pinea]
MEGSSECHCSDPKRQRRSPTKKAVLSAAEVEDDDSEADPAGKNGAATTADNAEVKAEGAADEAKADKTMIKDTFGENAGCRN